MEDIIKWGRARTIEVANLKDYKVRNKVAARMREIAKSWIEYGDGVYTLTISELREAFGDLVPVSWNEDEIRHRWCIYYNILIHRPQFLMID